MGKKATKAADNMYYLARCEAAETNADFSSREKAAELVGIDRTRLARIELDTIVPYPEEVKAMAKAYISTNLANSIVFAVLIVVLLVKPAGLLGKTVHEKV